MTEIEIKYYGEKRRKKEEKKEDEMERMKGIDGVVVEETVEVKVEREKEREREERRRKRDGPSRDGDVLVVESWLVKVGKRGNGGKEGGKREGKGRRLVWYGMYGIIGTVWLVWGGMDGFNGGKGGNPLGISYRGTHSLLVLR